MDLGLMGARLKGVPGDAPPDSSLAKGRGRLRVVVRPVRRGLPQHCALRLDRHGGLARDGGMARRSARSRRPDDDAQRPEDVQRARHQSIRNGVVLATNLRVPGVHADPSRLVDKASAARRLAVPSCSGVDANELLAAVHRGQALRLG